MPNQSPLSPTRAGSPRPFNVEFLHPAETRFCDHNFVLSPFIFSIFRGRGYKEKSYVFVCFWSGLGDVGITALYFRIITLVGDLLFRIFLVFLWGEVSKLCSGGGPGLLR